ncbi:nucleotidyltransferase family protein [Gordonia hankookensis]|uniref:NTP transferase domain-containing protein n=1 Tax=Gordonia hankookensis TaxID=589403 RepID=A0ABR7WDP9_9ACTN|nr:NTP transferase domain-containing protein [Gordonia hankookensis]MBD1320903.1 NTP transferase domain-containing protein [Gordonia hankookensis]
MIVEPSVPDRRRERGRLVGVVLAAGAGSRFGAPKIVAEDGDWLRRSVDALARGGCSDVYVAMGARIVDPPEGASAIIVPDWRSGLGETVRVVATAVRDLDADGMVLHVVDTPDVGPDVTNRLLAAVGRRRDGIARAVFDGRPGHPVYLGTDHLDGVIATVTGDMGAQPYLAAHRADLLLVECGDLANGRDRDTPG